jgi:hypothetical protein
MKLWKINPFLVLGFLFVSVWLFNIVSVKPLEPLPVANSAKIPSPLLISNVYPVAKLTGAGSINNTGQQYGLFGTDLGIMWDGGNGQLMLAFGDSYGKDWGGCGSGPRQADWRSNTLAFSADTSPEDGLTFSTMLQDSPGHAKEILASQKTDYQEITVIPTGGISVGTRNYLFYMSVNHWARAGSWYTNYAGVAYSDDFGQNWTISPDTRWENDGLDWNNKFQQVALVKNNGYVYMFGTSNGRLGNAYLARVSEQAVLDVSKYQYWDGQGWQTEAQEAATAVISGPVGELSVQYNAYYRLWLMVYFDQSQHALVLRTAENLTGPWSETQTLVNGLFYPQLYGGFIYPWANPGPDLYFTMSQWCAAPAPYNVSLMHATLTANVASKLQPLGQISSYPTPLDKMSS